jgi:hypothetical protein
MNTKSQLLIILIAGLFSFSSHFSATADISKEKVVKVESIEYASASSEGKATSGKQDKTLNNDITVPQTSPDKQGSAALNSDDDGVIHHIHLGRVRKARKCASLLCWIAKIILIVSHAAMLVFGFMHAIHH